MMNGINYYGENEPKNVNSDDVTLASFLALPLSEALQSLNLSGVQVHTDDAGIVKTVELKYTSVSKNERCPF